MSWALNPEEGGSSSGGGLGEGVEGGKDPRVSPMETGSLSLPSPDPSMRHKVGLQYNFGGKEDKWWMLTLGPLHHAGMFFMFGMEPRGL